MFMKSAIFFLLPALAAAQYYPPPDSTTAGASSASAAAPAVPSAPADTTGHMNVRKHNTTTLRGFHSRTNLVFID